MADEKISQMPAVSSLSGSELVPVVQSGVNMSATVSQFGGGGGSNQVKVDSSDTTADYLANKLVAGTDIGLTVLSPSGDESIQIDYTGATPQSAQGSQYAVQYTDGSGNFQGATGLTYYAPSGSTSCQANSGQVGLQLNYYTSTGVIGLSANGTCACTIGDNMLNQALNATDGTHNTILCDSGECLLATDGAHTVRINASTQAIMATDGTYTVTMCDGSNAIVCNGPLQLLGNLQSNSAGAATTLGTVIAAQPIYNVSNTIIGWMPVYDSIT